MIALLIKKLFTQYQQCLDQVSDLEKQQLLSKPKVWFFLFGKSMNFDDISTLKCLINFFYYIYFQFTLHVRCKPVSFKLYLTKMMSISKQESNFDNFRISPAV